MPLYEYVCSSCGKMFSLRHSYKEKVTTCTICGEEGTIEKVLLSTNFVLEKKTNKQEKTGTTTNKAIEDAKIDLETQKKELKKKNK